MTLEIPARAEHLERAAAFVRQAAAAAGLNSEDLSRVDLIVEEIFLNIVFHAYPEAHPGSVWIACRPAPEGGIEVEFADNGIAFDPLTAPEPDWSLSLADRPIGGLGIFLVKSLARACSYARRDGFNVLAFSAAPAPRPEPRTPA